MWYTVNGDNITVIESQRHDSARLSWHRSSAGFIRTGIVGIVGRSNARVEAGGGRYRGRHTSCSVPSKGSEYASNEPTNSRHFDWNDGLVRGQWVEYYIGATYHCVNQELWHMVYSGYNTSLDCWFTKRSSTVHHSATLQDGKTKDRSTKNVNMSRTEMSFRWRILGDSLQFRLPL